MDKIEEFVIVCCDTHGCGYGNGDGYGNDNGYGNGAFKH